MAYSFVSASSQYLSLSNGIITNLPFTMACWAYNDESTTGRTAFYIGNQSTTSRATLQVGNATTTNGASSVYGGTSVTNILSSSTVNVGQWSHLCCVFESTTLRLLYLNGAQVGTDTGNGGVPTGFNNLSIGSIWLNGVNGTFFQGAVSEAGIWNTNLTASEIVSLSKGFSCNKIRPESLVFYTPLIRNLVDLKVGATLTNNNSATAANHPRIYY